MNFGGRKFAVEGNQFKDSLFLQLVIYQFKNDSIFHGKYNVGLAIFDVVPVFKVFANHPAFIGNGKHGLAVNLEHAIFSVIEKNGKLKGWKLFNKISIGISVSVTCPRLMVH